MALAQLPYMLAGIEGRATLVTQNAFDSTDGRVDKILTLEAGVALHPKDQFGLLVGLRVLFPFAVGPSARYIQLPTFVLTGRFAVPF